jgi:hypothetical protein
MELAMLRIPLCENGHSASGGTGPGLSCRAATSWVAVGRCMGSTRRHAARTSRMAAHPDGTSGAAPVASCGGGAGRVWCCEDGIL